MVSFRIATIHQRVYQCMTDESSHAYTSTTRHTRLYAKDVVQETEDRPFLYTRHVWRMGFGEKKQTTPTGEEGLRARNSCTPDVTTMKPRNVAVWTAERLTKTLEQGFHGQEMAKQLMLYQFVVLSDGACRNTTLLKTYEKKTYLQVREQQWLTTLALRGKTVFGTPRIGEDDL